MAVPDDGGHVLTGEDFGAIRVLNLDNLYEAQRRAVEDVVTGIHSIACKDSEVRRLAQADDEVGNQALRASREYDRPHHCYVVDGVRGSGKTTALLTIRSLVEIMTLGSSDDAARRRNTRIEGRGA